MPSTASPTLSLTRSPNARTICLAALAIARSWEQSASEVDEIDRLENVELGPILVDAEIDCTWILAL